MYEHFMETSKTIFTFHALERLLQRQKTRLDVLEVIAKHHIVENYPDSKPYPCQLIMGFAQMKALHVVIAVDKIAQSVIIITAYWPDYEKWDDDFLKRLKS